MPYTPSSGDTVRLRFRGTWTPPPGDQVPLPFGEVDGSSYLVQVQTLTGEGVVFGPIDGAGVLDQMQTLGGAGGLVEPLPPPFAGPAPVFGASWGDGDRRDREIRLRAGATAPRDRSIRILLAPADPSDRALDLAWDAATPGDRQITAPHQDAPEHADRELDAAWGAANAHDRELALRWATPTPRDREHELPWIRPAVRDVPRRIAWDAAAPLDRQLFTAWHEPPARDRHVRIPWEDATPLPYGRYPIPPYIPPTPIPHSCYSPPRGDRVALRFRGLEAYAPAAGDQVALPFRCGIDNFFYIGRALVISNSIYVVRLPDRLPLDVTAVSASLDLDSWAWSFTLRIASRASLTAVLPSPETGPQSIEIGINGHVWTALVERYSDNRANGATQFTASGRSRTALLAEPYATPHALISASARNAQQLALDELDFSGFALDWVTEDWLVPAGSWSYDSETPATAVARIAASIGAVVQSDPADDTLHVVSRYPVSPWQWSDAGVETDAVLDAGSCVSIGLEWQPGAGYQGVYVSGTTAGVVVRVSRDGTDGTPYAELVTDPLITETVAGRERGRVLIADAEDKQVQTLVLPLLADPEPPGLLRPGSLIEIQDPVWGTHRSLVTGCAVEASVTDDVVTVRQRITVQRHYRSA